MSPFSFCEVCNQIHGQTKVLAGGGRYQSDMWSDMRESFGRAGAIPSEKNSPKSSDKSENCNVISSLAGGSCSAVRDNPG